MQNRKIYICAAFYRQFCLYITCKMCYDTQYIMKLDISAIHLYKSTDYKSTTQMCQAFHQNELGKLDGNIYN